MDPEILTLSLGTWMSLPGMPYEAHNSSEKRATARSVAEYYERYVKDMELTANFLNQVLVTKIHPYCEVHGRVKCEKWVEKVNSDLRYKMRLCQHPDRKDCLSNAFSYIFNRTHMRNAKRTWMSCDKFNAPTVPQRTTTTRCRDRMQCCDAPKWIVEAVNLRTKTRMHFTCNHLVMANGTSDMPNKLNISKYKTEPYWLLHDLRTLEMELGLYLQVVHAHPDPVLVVGAGLSAADAIIAIKARNVPVVHLFRNQTDLTKQLPENMYPEYHKVHQMMKDGTTYPLYSSLPEYTLTNLDEFKHTAQLTSTTGKRIDLRVSFVVVLIGSRPDLSFLPENYNLAVKKTLPIDGKKNTMSIDKLTHQVMGYEGMYAIGPLAGDNFVRFLPGGALAVVGHIRQHADSVA